MSIAAAIQMATGRIAGDDFSVQDDGKGPYLAKWNAATLGARPSDAQINSWLATYNAGAEAREGMALVRQIAQEYLIATIVNQEFGDNARLLAVKAKLASWKAAHPGIIP
jgi:hypothetical protein